MRCRICGCTDSHACVGADGEPCHWAAAELCSECAQALAETDEMYWSSGELDETPLLYGPDGEVVRYD